MDFLFVIKLLIKKKWYLILIPIASACLSFLLSMDIKPEYKSSGKLATRFTTEDRISVTNEKSNVRDADIKINNLLEMMSSELITSMVSYRLLINDLTSARPHRLPTIEEHGLISKTYKQETI